MRRRVWMLVLLIAAVAAGLWWRGRSAETAPSWRTATVERKDVRSTVSATGSLEPVTTVEVGTQVSGTIKSLFANYNDHVTAGQVLAKLDTDLLSADVSSARASLELRSAELAEASANLKAAEALHATGALTESELLAASTAKSVAAAQRTSAGVSLERAERALRYATITAPIDGTVLARDVEEGQTVNAGTSAPRLFLLAGDLTRLQIVANVDEADIGRVKEGQAVEFTAAAYDNEVFQGVVRQVRLSATVTDNVTSYPVVIDVANPDGRLLPGMTATVSIIVATSPGALCVLNPALRFKPDEALVSGERGGKGPGLWLPVAGGRLERLPVETGLTDASCTEVRGEGLSEGLTVVIGEDRGASGSGSGSSGGAGRSGGTGSSSPFQSSSSSGGRPGGPGGGRPGGF